MSEEQGLLQYHIVRNRSISPSEDDDLRYNPIKPTSSPTSTKSSSSIHRAAESKPRSVSISEDVIRDDSFNKPKSSIPRNESMFSMLTRSTSIMTWATSDTIPEENTDAIEREENDDGYDYDDNGSYMFPTLVKKLSINRKRYIPFPYGYGSTSTEEAPAQKDVAVKDNLSEEVIQKDSVDDSLSDCSYETGVQDSTTSDSSHPSFVSFDEENPEVDIESPKSATTRGPTPLTPQEFILNQDNDYIIQTRTIESGEDPQEETYTTEKMYLSENYLIRTCVEIREKSRGVKAYSPVSSFSSTECAWTFAGSFTIIALLTFCSSQIAIWAEEGRAYAFPLGPFGALTTLQYSITDASPAQPRNVLIGSTICGVVAMASTHIPESIIPIWIRIALATATSISIMARAGIQHPPGGAIALVFAMGNHSWLHLIMTLCGCFVAVLLATLVNNLNMNRQYPQYWDFFGSFRRKDQEQLPGFNISV